MKNPFRLPTVQELVAEELNGSRLELLVAESTLEFWVARRDMLIKRIARLEQEVPRD